MLRVLKFLGSNEEEIEASASNPLPVTPSPLTLDPATSAPYVNEAAVAADATPPTAFVAAGTGWEYNLDINTALGRNAQHGYIANDGNGKIVVAVSINGTTGSSAFTVQPGEVTPLELMNIDTIQVNGAHATQAGAMRLLLY